MKIDHCSPNIVKHLESLLKLGEEEFHCWGETFLGVARGSRKRWEMSQSYFFYAFPPSNLRFKVIGAVPAGAIIHASI